MTYVFFRSTFSNPFHATGLFLYPRKTSENQRFSDFFRGYRKRLVTWNWSVKEVYKSLQIIIRVKNKCKKQTGWSALSFS